MKRSAAASTFALIAIAATTLFAAPARAHHSQAMFDQSREILIEGTVARLDWKNPHIYLIVETEDENGETLLIQGEGLAITQALVDGLDPAALTPGTPIVVRANPNRGGRDKTIRVLDVETRDGVIHPFYSANPVARRLTPADSLAGNWAPSLQATGKAFGEAAGWPYTAAGREAQVEDLNAEATCYVEPIPFLSMLNEIRIIEIDSTEVVIRYDNSGDFARRVIPFAEQHAANVEPSLFGDSIAQWEGETLVIDTIAFEPNPWGLYAGVPSSAGKRTEERFTLNEDRLQLTYESTVEDPMYLEEPVTYTMLWDHRPDLEFSPQNEACDDDIAHRYLED